MRVPAAPDAIDLAYADWGGDSLERRTKGHIPDHLVDDVFAMLRAHSDRYEWAPMHEGGHFRHFRPFQTNGNLLDTQPGAERDAAFSTHLTERGLRVMTESIATDDGALAPANEIMAIDLVKLPAGFEMPLYSGGKRRGQSQSTDFE